MQLSLRLSAIADMVTKGNRLVDVGCDHGYLPVYLIQQGKIPSAVAMDVRKGPLSRAQEHIRQYGMEPYIQTRLSDGLQNLKAGEGDTLVIAGMGGPLMERILTEGQQVRDSFSELILQPQSDIPHFRRYIIAQGYKIAEEKMVEEDGKFYPMMRVVREDKKQEKLPNTKQEEQLYTLEESFGVLLLKAHDPVLYRYLKKEAGVREKILKQLEAAPAAEGINKRTLEVKEEVRLIEAALAEYES